MYVQAHRALDAICFSSRSPSSFAPRFKTTSRHHCADCAIGTGVRSASGGFAAPAAGQRRLERGIERRARRNRRRHRPQDARSAGPILAGERLYRGSGHVRPGQPRSVRLVKFRYHPGHRALVRPGLSDQGRGSGGAGCAETGGSCSRTGEEADSITRLRARDGGTDLT